MESVKAMKVLVWMDFFMLGVESVSDAFDGLDDVITAGRFLDLLTQSIDMDPHRFRERISIIIPALLKQFFRTDDAFPVGDEIGQDRVFFEGQQDLFALEDHLMQIKIDTEISDA